MKQKKLVFSFLIVAISLILFLPILNLSLMYKNKKTNAHGFTKQQLFSLDNFESIKNYFVYKIFNISLNEWQVVTGKDHFLFLGNCYSSVIDKTKGTFLYTNKDIDIWTTKLKKLQEWYKKQGIEFIIVVAPNKHTVYSDKLPDSIVYKEGATITDDLVKYSLNKNIHILNLKKALRAKKQNMQLYFHTDTHWNNYGALIGYIETIKYLNITYGKNYKIAEYKYKIEDTRHAGDLTNFLRINYLLSSNYEKNYSLIFKKKSKVCYGKITKTNKLKKCNHVVKNTFNQYIINKNSLNKEKLLYLCDSFGGANTQLYKETFNTVWKFHLANKHGTDLADFLQEHKPDVVIYQVVERDLFSMFLIAEIPQIFKASTL